jgi:GT2 family glycosyltransferase
LKKNFGFSKAINEGIKVSTGDCIALLNNDTIADKDWLLEGVKPISLQKSEIVSSKLISFYNKKIIDGAGDKFNIAGQACSRGFQESDKSPWNLPCYVFSATGGASIISKDVIDRVGLLEEEYFAYFEDFDFCYRAQKQNLRVWYEPKSFVIHYHKATSQQNPCYLDFLLYKNYALNYLINTPIYMMLMNKSLIKFFLVYVNTFIWMITTKKCYKTPFLVQFWIIKNIIKVLQLRRTRNLQIVSIAYLNSWRENKELNLKFFKF